MNALISGSFGLFLMAGVVGLLVAGMKNGELERNSAIGIRTRATMSSDEAWRQGHLAAAPWTRACAATALGAGILSLVLGLVIVEPGNALTAVVLPGGYGAVIVLVILAARAANRAAAGAGRASGRV